jgi:nitrite reductase (NADH) large subunit
LVIRHVIVGDGVAGVVAARTIARVRPEAEVHIYASEPHYYYSRPRLWEFLAGGIEEEALRFYPPAWYQERGIHVHRGTRVDRLIPERRQAGLTDGQMVSYDRLLLATGSHPFVPPIPGVEKEGVFTLRTIEDARGMRTCAQEARHAVVIGGGLLGLETARALRILGLEVTVVEVFPRLLPRQLDAEGAALLADMIEEMGLRVITGASIQAIAGYDRARGVVLRTGETVPGDLVLVSAGVRPNLGLAREAGLIINRGVVVDEYMRTSAENVYAAGDVAEFQGQVPCIIPVAIEQGRVAGMHMAGGDPKPYRGIVPSYTLKVVGIDLTSVGVIIPEGEGYEEHRRVDEAGYRYRKIVLKDGRLVGAILLGETEGMGSMSRLISEGVDLSAHAERLLDDDFDLQSLMALV